MRAEFSLRPPEMCMYQVSSAAVAWIFELRRRQKIGGTASPRSTAKGQIHFSKPRHPNDAIAASLSAQPDRYDCRSRRGQRFFNPIRWLWLTIAVWIHAQPLNVRSPTSIRRLLYRLPILQNRGDNGTLLVNEPATIDDSSGLQSSWKAFDQKGKADMSASSQEIDPPIEVKNFRN